LEINLSHVLQEYEKKLNQFLNFQKKKKNSSHSNERFFCPYINYMNGRVEAIDIIQNILFMSDGFSRIR